MIILIAQGQGCRCPSTLGLRLLHTSSGGGITPPCRVMVNVRRVSGWEVHRPGRCFISRVYYSSLACAVSDSCLQNTQPVRDGKTLQGRGDGKGFKEGWANQKAQRASLRQAGRKRTNIHFLLSPALKSLWLKSSVRTNVPVVLRRRSFIL